MGLRATIEHRPIVGIMIAVVLLSVVATIMISRSSASSTAGLRFYYDVTTGEVTAFKAAESLPPVTLASGHEGVLARVFACGVCDNETFVGYLEKYTDAYKRAVLVSPGDAPGPVVPPAAGHLIAAKPADGQPAQWVVVDSAQGRHVRQAPREQCARDVVECLP